MVQDSIPDVTTALLEKVHVSILVAEHAQSLDREDELVIWI
jgi:hypothetical protein